MSETTPNVDDVMAEMAWWDAVTAAHEVTRLRSALAAARREVETVTKEREEERAALEDVRRVEAWLAMDPARRQVRVVTGKLQAVRDVSLGLAPHWIVVAVADSTEALGRALAQEAGDAQH